MKEGYKDSVLGEIPVVWKIEQLKNTSNQEKHSFIDGDWIESPYISDSGIRLIQTGNIGIGNFIDKNKKHISESSFIELKCKEVIEGDILICRLAAPVGRACIVPNLGTKNITSVDVTICRPNINVNKVYLINYLNFQPTLNRMENLSGGSTRQRINRTNLGKIEIPIPPLPEQQKIAEILSTVDAKIEIIDQQITETQELKKGLMQQLLTKGIGHTEFKDSVLGKIPKSWEVVKISKVADVKGGKRIPKGESLTEEKTSHPYIRVADMFMGGVSLEKILYVPENIFPIIKKYTISKDDLFISVAGTLGIVGEIPNELDGANLTENADKLSNIKISKLFLLQVLLSPIIQTAIEREKTNNAQPKLALAKIRSFEIPKPSKEEQLKIAEILSTTDKKLEVLSEKKTTYQELKQGLMQQLLTGKVRV
jgi:type I restriction enzyme S subunit